MKLTLWTLYKYTDGSLFDKLQVPDNVDRDNVISSILDECGEFGLIYADADFMQMIIGVWSTRELPIWQKLEETLHYDYDPISNYDRIEDSTRDVTGTGTGSETAFDSGELATVNGSQSAGNEVFHSRIRGNIGVTTSQQMIQAQRDLVQFNIVNYIVASFRSRFSIDVYS